MKTLLIPASIVLVSLLGSVLVDVWWRKWGRVRIRRLDPISRDWDTPEEDKAWAYLSRKR